MRCTIIIIIVLLNININYINLKNEIKKMYINKPLYVNYINHINQLKIIKHCFKDVYVNYIN